MRNHLKALAILAAAALPAGAQAGTIVNFSGAVTGCTPCNGNHPVAGDTVSSLINPVLQTFDAGTYRVTNGAGQAGATPGYDGWNFNLGSGTNWIWSFVIVDPATKKVVLDSLPDPAAFVGSHAAVASAAYALDYSGTFTLAAKTELAFVTEDYYPTDNLGGMALNISRVTAAVPEPATWAIMVLGFATLGGMLRARKRPTEALA